jgi:hypothetical protein
MSAPLQKGTYTMPIQLSWYLRGQILLATIDGAISDQDSVAYDEQILSYLMDAELLVHVVTDFSGLEIIQSDIAPRDTDGDGDALRKHPLIGQIVCISTNRMLAYLFPFHSWALKPCHARFDTLDDALAYLCDLDPALPRAQLLPCIPLPQPA